MSALTECRPATLVREPNEYDGLDHCVELFCAPIDESSRQRPGPIASDELDLRTSFVPIENLGAACLTVPSRSCAYAPGPGLRLSPSESSCRRAEPKRTWRRRRERA